MQSGNLPSRKSTKENGKEIRLNVVCGVLMMFHLRPSSRRTLIHFAHFAVCFCAHWGWKIQKIQKYWWKMHKILLSLLLSFSFAFRFTLIKFIFSLVFVVFVEFIWFPFQLYLEIESCIKALNFVPFFSLFFRISFQQQQECMTKMSMKFSSLFIKPLFFHSFSLNFTLNRYMLRLYNVVYVVFALNKKQLSRRREKRSFKVNKTNTIFHEWMCTWHSWQSLLNAIKNNKVF